MAMAARMRAATGSGASFFCFLSSIRGRGAFFSARRAGAGPGSGSSYLLRDVITECVVRLSCPVSSSKSSIGTSNQARRSVHPSARVRKKRARVVFRSSKAFHSSSERRVAFSKHGPPKKRGSGSSRSSSYPSAIRESAINASRVRASSNGKKRDCGRFSRPPPSQIVKETPSSHGTGLSHPCDDPTRTANVRRSGSAGVPDRRAPTATRSYRTYSGTVNPNLRMTPAMTTSVFARTNIVAIRSLGVSCKFTITSFPRFPFLFRTVKSGMSHDGVICRLDPSTRDKQVSLLCFSALRNSSGGNASSQSSTWSRSRATWERDADARLDLRGANESRESDEHPRLRLFFCSSANAPHLSHVLPVYSNPTVLISKSRMYSFAHRSHRSAKQFPCSSARSSLGNPDRRCRQSTLHETRYRTYPCLRNSTSAMCVRLGTAVSSVHFASGMGAPRFCAVHTPFGPRKSGIPMEVLMPAPVWTTMPPDFARLSRISSASASILRWSSASSASSNSGVPSVPPTSSRHDRRSAYPMEPAMVPPRRASPRVA
mmetsp:Transcript_984/g.4173  ORF Transcript_984/g.4173 Transcript_984/m.4173 type:complete len:543 (+) Transcript_984:515-2143(+)